MILLMPFKGSNIKPFGTYLNSIISLIETDNIT